MHRGRKIEEPGLLSGPFEIDVVKPMDCVTRSSLRCEAEFAWVGLLGERFPNMIKVFDIRYFDADAVNGRIVYRSSNWSKIGGCNGEKSDVDSGGRRGRCVSGAGARKGSGYTGAAGKPVRRLDPVADRPKPRTLRPRSLSRRSVARAARLRREAAAVGCLLSLDEALRPGVQLSADTPAARCRAAHPADAGHADQRGGDPVRPRWSHDPRGCSCRQPRADRFSRSAGHAEPVAHHGIRANPPGLSE